MKYKVIVPRLINPETSPRCDWCEENIGGEGVDWAVNPSYTVKPLSGSIFLFRHEKDAVMFSLLWSGREI